MLLPPPTLSLMIVCDDWFARSLLASVSEESTRFQRVTTADDGYSALAETWQGVEDGMPPNVFLIDAASVGPSADRLVLELRNDPATEHAYVVVLTGEEPVSIPRADYSTSCRLDVGEMTELLESIANAAAISAQWDRPAC